MKLFTRQCKECQTLSAADALYEEHPFLTQLDIAEEAQREAALAIAMQVAAGETPSLTDMEVFRELAADVAHMDKLWQEIKNR